MEDDFLLRICRLGATLVPNCVSTTKLALPYHVPASLSSVTIGRTSSHESGSGQGEDVQVRGEMVLTKQQREATRSILALLQAQESGSRNLADVFQELPPRKELPDYYKVITRPMALDAVKSRAKNGKYTVFADFLRDLAQIFHNAKLYNLKRSLVHADACALEKVLNAELVRLHETKVCRETELPAVGDEAPEGSGDEDEAGSSDNEDDNLQTPKPKKLKISIKSEATPAAAAGSTEDDRTSPSTAKKRLRPPNVESPDETRMKNILRSLRRVQRDGDTLFEPFEKLPDVKEYPDYYEHIKNPMSLALVKKNVKRKLYCVPNGMDHFKQDVRTIFANAQFYNEDKSDIHQAATYFLTQLDDIISIEVARPDSDFANVEPQEKSSAQTGGMVKLARKGVAKILQRGEEYKVGDWVYLENPNDPPFPIIAQIFRTWQNSDGQYWVNVCWYYRPFQTVHRADKLWYDREVVKTGQYRDHSAQELIGHCYIMYVTKYVRGRPREWTGADEDLWVCENRYNEEAVTYNKIKAWKSCVPEESREQCSNFEMELFPDVRPPKKFLSPLLHLMPEDKSLWVNPPEPVEGTVVKYPEPRDRGVGNGPPKLGNLIVSAVPTEEQLKQINGELPRPAAQPALVAPIPQKPAAGMVMVQQPGQYPRTPVHAGQGGHIPANIYQTTPTVTSGQGGGGGPPQHHQQQTYQRQVQQYRPPPGGQQLQQPGYNNFTGNTAGTPPVYATPQYARNNNNNAPGAQLKSGNTTPQNSYRGPMRPAPTSATNYRTPAPTTTSNVAPILPPMPANTNKLNSLGSQINPTAMVFLHSFGMTESARRLFARDAAGEVLWFSVPPQESVRPAQVGGGTLTHSIPYLAWRRKRSIEELSSS